MTHVFLVGFMGAGKSTVGRILAGSLGRPFIDLDERIEQAEGRSIAEIFEVDGEETFRSVERGSLEGLAHELPSVVASGGGVVVRAENRSTLKDLGTVVYLVVGAGEALARIGDATTRPLLSGAGGVMAATTLLSARESLYTAVADITVDTTGKSAAEVADQVLSGLRERGVSS